MQLWENDHFTFLPPNSNERQAYIAWGKKDVFVLNENNPEDILKLNNWLAEKTTPVFGYISFEAKKLFEKNVYHNVCSDGSEILYFFEPQHVWKEENGNWIPLTETEPNEHSVIDSFISNYTKIEIASNEEKLSFEMLESKVSYVEKIQSVLNHIQRGDYLRQSQSIQQLNSNAIQSVRAVYDRGVAQGVFRSGLDPVDIHSAISAFTS